MSTTTAFKPLTKDDLADVLGVSLRTIENWVNDRTLPAPKKLGNRVYWHPNIFYAWLEHRLTAKDACAEVGGSTLEPPSRKKPDTKHQFRSKAPKIEFDKLRSREQAKLEAMLS